MYWKHGCVYPLLEAFLLWELRAQNLPRPRECAHQEKILDMYSVLGIIMRGVISTSSTCFQTFIFWLWGKWHHHLVTGLKHTWHPVGQHPNLSGWSHSMRALSEPLLAIPLFYQTSCLPMMGYKIGSLNSMVISLLLHNFCIAMSPFARGNVVQDTMMMKKRFNSFSDESVGRRVSDKEDKSAHRICF